MKLKLMFGMVALSISSMLLAGPLDTTCGIVRNGELINVSPTNKEYALYSHKRTFGDLLCSCNNKDISGTAKRACNQPGADSATVTVCTIVDKNRLPVWAHFEPGTRGSIGKYIEHTGPNKFDRVTNKEIINYATILTYVVPGTSCSVNADRNRMPPLMFKFANDNGYNSANPTTMAAAVRKIQGEMMFETVTKQLQMYIEAGARALGDKLQPVGDKLDARVSQITNSATGQRIQSGLQSAGKKIDDLAQDVSRTTNRAVQKSF